MKKAKEAGINAGGMAIAGLVCSIIGLVLALILTIVAICTACYITNTMNALQSFM